MKALVTFGIFLAASAHAREEKPLHPNYKLAVPYSITSCETGKYAFQLNLGDDKKDADEIEEEKEFGYRYFWIIPKNGEAISALPPKEYNEIRFLSPAATSQSVCKDTIALPDSDSVVAIFVRQNNRPFEDYLSVVFFDPTKRKVVAYNRNLGVSDHVEKVSNGFDFKVFNPPTDVGSFNVTVRGHASSTTEETFEYWNLLTRKNDQTHVEADPTVTWARSMYRPYFKSRDEFEKAFGFDKEKGIYQNKWIYRVKEPNCIQPSKERRAVSINAKWFCAANVPASKPT